MTYLANIVSPSREPCFWESNPLLSSRHFCAANISFWIVNSNNNVKKYVGLEQNDLTPLSSAQAFGTVVGTPNSSETSRVKSRCDALPRKSLEDGGKKSYAQRTTVVRFLEAHTQRFGSSEEDWRIRDAHQKESRNDRPFSSTIRRKEGIFFL